MQESNRPRQESSERSETQPASKPQAPVPSDQEERLQHLLECRSFRHFLDELDQERKALLTALSKTANSREFDLVVKGKIATINRIFEFHQAAAEKMNSLIEGENEEESMEEL